MAYTKANLNDDLVNLLFMSEYYQNHLNEANIGTSDREITSMMTGDCSNTNFGAVMNLLKDLTDVPDYLVVLSDMEFDEGSSMSKSETMKLFKERGYKTRIIWWSMNARNKTSPEIVEKDTDGNIFISGYSPMLLKYLECWFNASQFIDKLLDEYQKKVEA